MLIKLPKVLQNLPGKLIADQPGNYIASKFHGMYNYRQQPVSNNITTEGPNKNPRI